MGLLNLFSRRETPVPQTGGNDPAISFPQDEVCVAVKITGGLGDVIVHARVIAELAKLSPKIHFYIFPAAFKAGQWIFRGVRAPIDVLPPSLFDFYCKAGVDMILFLNTFAVFNEQNVNIPKITKLAPLLLNALSSTMQTRLPWNVFIDRHPFLDGAFAHMASARRFSRYDFIPQMLGIPVPDNRLDLPSSDKEYQKLQAAYPSYITFNTGFDESFPLSSRTTTKSYPVEHWTRLIAAIHQEYPDLGIVQVGGKNSLPIAGADINLAGRTTLEECAGILKHAVLHLDTEGGLVHVCASLGVQSAVLFGPTNLEYFAYPQNINIRNSRCPDCWWSTQTWMEHCPRLNPRAECMYENTPELVLMRIRPALQKVSSKA